MAIKKELFTFRSIFFRVKIYTFSLVYFSFVCRRKKFSNFGRKSFLKHCDKEKYQYKLYFANFIFMYSTQVYSKHMSLSSLLVFALLRVIKASHKLPLWRNTATINILECSHDFFFVLFSATSSLSLFQQNLIPLEMRFSS